MLAQQLLDKKQPANYNQAIMDFGATQCTHKTPKCRSCSFSYDCVAYNTNMIDKLPVKSKKNKLKHRESNEKPNDSRTIDKQDREDT